MAALVLAICIRLKMPSCIRAPPLAVKMMSGRRWAAAYSTARVTFSPTPSPMLPMKKRLSITTTTAGWPSMRPTALTTASSSPVFFFCMASFSL